MKNVVHQAYKFRIYPDKAQTQVLHQHFGSCRFVYNHFLNERIEFYQKNKDKQASLFKPKPKKVPLAIMTMPRTYPAQNS